MSSTLKLSQIKLNKLKSLLKRKELDAVLVENADDVRYLTTFSCSFGMVLVTKSKAYFLTDTRYELEAEKNPVVADCFELVIQRKSGMETLFSLFRIAKINTCIIDSENTSISRFNQLKEKCAPVQFIPVENIIKDLRLIKTPDETEKIISALRIAEKSFIETLSYVKEGVSEKSLKTELEYRFQKNGGESPSFPTIIASGTNAATPHASITDKKLKNHEMVIFDFGVRLEGYNSDTTRTIYLGKPDKVFIERYNSVKEAVIKAEKNIKLGMSSKKADEIARSFLKAKKLERYFTHSLGHGIGCEVHERPYLNPKGADILQPGMVFSIEPGIYIKDWGGIRIEDLVLLGKNGTKVITELKKELIVI